MRVYYALYDQSYDNNAQYWTWFPGEITQQMRDAIASKSGAFQMRPKHPNLLSEPDIVGGIINYQDQWCIVYRYFNGGNDPQGRPDRCVLATAWVRTEEAQGQNLYDLLFCPVFLDVQRQAIYQCPVQVPRALIEDCNCPVSQNDPQLAIYYNNPNIGSWTFRNANEVEVVGKLFPNLVEDGLKSLQVLQSAAYMETFSGTPLASGIMYVPKVVTQPESVEYVGDNDYPGRQPSSRNPNLVFLLIILFICSSLLAVDRLTNHGFIKLIIRGIGITEGQTLDRQKTDSQTPEVLNPDEPTSEAPNPEEQNPEEPIPVVQTPETPTPETPTPEAPNSNGQNPSGQNPNEQESGRPIYPSEPPIPQGNPQQEPNAGMSGTPLIKP